MGSVAGAYYYLTAVSPQNAAPTPSPSPVVSPTPNISPSTLPTPFQSPSTSPTPASSLSPTSTSTAFTIPTITPTPTPTPTPSPAPAPWSLVNVTRTATSSYLRSYSFGLTTGLVFQPNSADYIFLLVKFELNANDNANTLDAKELVLLVDGTSQLRPIGLNTLIAVSSYNCYVGNFTGTINRTKADFLVYSEVDGRVVPNYSSINLGNLPVLAFIYQLPRTSLDGTHSLELRIAGTTSGISFTVEPP
jgi:hypothetical protein